MMVGETAKRDLKINHFVILEKDVIRNAASPPRNQMEEEKGEPVSAGAHNRRHKRPW
jgi:hypothetical protein